jgi:hypothetical protein
MKKQIFLTLAFASLLALTSVASSDYRPPGKEQVKTEIAAQMNPSDVVIVYSYAENDYTATIFSGNTPVAEPLSIFVVAKAIPTEAKVVLHDYGNIISCSSLSSASNTSYLRFERLYLSNCAIRQCIC